MNTQKMQPIMPTGAEADQRVQQAVRAAVQEHKRVGNPVATWQDGKVVWIPADEIDVPEDDSE